MGQGLHGSAAKRRDAIQCDGRRFWIAQSALPSRKDDVIFAKGIVPKERRIFFAITGVVILLQPFLQGR